MESQDSLNIGKAENGVQLTKRSPEEEEEKDEKIRLAKERLAQRKENREEEHGKSKKIKF